MDAIDFLTVDDVLVAHLDQTRRYGVVEREVGPNELNRREQRKQRKGEGTIKWVGSTIPEVKVNHSICHGFRHANHFCLCSLCSLLFISLGCHRSAAYKAFVNTGDRLHPLEMAAAYLFHIVKNHPFVDGNKRTGAVRSTRRVMLEYRL